MTFATTAWRHAVASQQAGVGWKAGHGSGHVLVPRGKGDALVKWPLILAAGLAVAIALALHGMGLPHSSRASGIPSTSLILSSIVRKLWRPYISTGRAGSRVGRPYSSTNFVVET